MIKESEKKCKKRDFSFFSILSFKSHPEQTMHEKRFCFFAQYLIFFLFFSVKTL